MSASGRLPPVALRSSSFSANVSNGSTPAIGQRRRRLAFCHCRRVPGYTHRQRMFTSREATQAQLRLESVRSRSVSESSHFCSARRAGNKNKISSLRSLTHRGRFEPPTPIFGLQLASIGPTPEWDRPRLVGAGTRFGLCRPDRASPRHIQTPIIRTSDIFLFSKFRIRARLKVSTGEEGPAVGRGEPQKFGEESNWSWGAW